MTTVRKFLMAGVLLAVLPLSTVHAGGFIGIANNYDSQFVDAAGADAHGPLTLTQQLVEPLHNIVPMLCGLAAAVAGIFIAFSIYKNAAADPLPAKLGSLATAMKNRFYFDELYEATVIRLHDFIAAVCDWLDRWIVEGLCIGLIRGGTNFTGRALRLVQTGNLQTYAFLFVFGVALLLYFVLVK